MSFSISHRTRGPLPRIPFKKIKDAVLGTEYDLSLALIPADEAAAVTRRTKHKDKPSNTLAFPLSQISGEILICPATARVQAPEHHMDPRTFVTFLFIHSLLHLQGLDHGGTMEHEEHRIMQMFGLCTNEQHRNRHRYRVIPGKSSHR